MPLQTTTERKLVTVLVVDTVGSTALAERMDPEEWTGIMFAAHERMKQAIHTFGGTVAQFTGDGLIAFFGAPRTREDDAVRAVQAALELGDRLEEFARDLVEANRVPHFQVRIGLHTGIVLVGDVGNAQFSEYLAVGETVTLAQHAQSAAAPGTLVLTNETARLVASAFELGATGELETSGGRQTTLWRVSQPRTKAHPETASTPLVGREREMETLRTVVNRLGDGKGALVSIIGEAGIGKSRLVDEMRGYTQMQFPDVHWFQARGVTMGGGIYSLFQQILRASLGISPQDSTQAIRMRLELGAQRQNFQDPALVVQMLELMLAIENKDAAGYAMSGAEVQRALFETVRNTKRALAKNRPTVFVLEEMHWADAASVELTLHDADLVRELPLLIVTTFRPDRDAPSWNYRAECAARFADVYVEIELEALGTDESSRLLEILAGETPLPAPVRARILSKTEGNPFFMEQLVSGLEEANALTNDTDLVVPNSVNAVIAARLDRLGEPTRRVLEAAAVIGRTFPPGLLKSVIERAGWEDLAESLDLHLAVSQRQQLIVPRVLDAVPQYAFKHALIQDAVYASLMKKRRRELHCYALQSMMEFYAGRTDEHAAELACHAEIGEDWRRAYEFARRAAETAVRVYERPEARVQYQRALEAIRKIQDTETDVTSARAEIERVLATL